MSNSDYTQDAYQRIIDFKNQIKEHLYNLTIDAQASADDELQKAIIDVANINNKIISSTNIDELIHSVINTNIFQP